MPLQLTDLPEELLERILAYLLEPPHFNSDNVHHYTSAVQPHLLHPSRPQGSAVPPSPTSPTASAATSLASSISGTSFPAGHLGDGLTPADATPPKPRLPISFLRPRVPLYAPLLVNRLFRRIGTSVLYGHLHLTSAAQARLALRTLRERPELGACVRRLRVDGVWACVEELLACLSPSDSAVLAPETDLEVEGVALVKGKSQENRARQPPQPRLEAFDFSIDFGEPYTLVSYRDEPHDVDVEAFLRALARLPELGTVSRLTIRRAPNSYINMLGPSRVLDLLGEVIEGWVGLETIDVAFRLPYGPPVTATNLVNALAQLHPPTHAPALVGAVPFTQPNLNGAQNGVVILNGFGNGLAHPPPNANAGAAAGGGQVSARFVHALARAPSLRVVHAHMPAVWNTAFLEISHNPNLVALVLTPSPTTATAGEHLFLATARKHERLYALIEAGVRLRLTGSPLPLPPPIQA